MVGYMPELVWPLDISLINFKDSPYTVFNILFMLTVLCRVGTRLAFEFSLVSKPASLSAVWFPFSFWLKIFLNLSSVF